MPYPNFHSGRVLDPSKFEASSFRYVKLKGTSVETVMGKLKGEKTMTVQAYRFPKGEYTVAEAKAWLKKEGVKPILFEAAKESTEDSIEYADEEITLMDALNATIKTDQRFDTGVIPVSKTVGRIDTVNSMQWMARPFERTSEGFLKGRAIVTSVGVFEYRNADGSTQYELRLPEEVFDRESIESLKLKPVANDHPKEVVTPENVKEYQVGNLGDNPGSISDTGGYIGWVETEKRTDGLHLAIDMMVTEAGAIQDVLNGKQALSCGYVCDLEESSGRWCGVKYDYIQRRIRYNHVAIVNEARAGDAARIRLDSKDAVLVNNIKEANMPGMMKKITLDSVEYEAEAKVIETLSKEKGRADEMQASLDAMKEEFSKVCAERDALKDKVEKLMKDIDEMKGKKKDGFDEEVKAAVEKRLVVLDAAKKAGVEKVDGVSDTDLMKQVILKVSPEAKLDDKDAVYLSARFDGAVELLTIQTQNNDSVRALGGQALPRMDRGSLDGKGARSADQARQDMIDRMVNGKNSEEVNKGGK